jgi:hypothetical protein
MTLLGRPGAGDNRHAAPQVLQGQLARNLPPVIPDTFTGLQTDGQRAAIRALDSLCDNGAGRRKQIAHVDENMATAKSLRLRGNNTQALS